VTPRLPVLRKLREFKRRCADLIMKCFCLNPDLAPFVVSGTRTILCTSFKPLHFLFSLSLPFSLFIFNQTTRNKPIRYGPPWDDTLKRRSEFATLHKETIDADREQAATKRLNIFWHSAKCFTNPLLVVCNRHANGRSNL